MSASSKKKARSQEVSAKLTEKQLAEQKEAAKLKVYTITFAAVLAVLVVIAAWVGISRTISSSGMQEKKTVAATVGNHSINSVEMNYYFMDAVNNFNSTYGTYAAMFGLDVTKPLNEQVTNEETGATWADDFIQNALSSAQSTYALADAANAAGFTLPEDQQAQIDSLGSTLDLYATMSNFDSGDAYVKAMYGNGASKDSYLEYYARNALANAYYNAYQESLTFDDAAIQAKDQENPAAYSSYSYNQYYVNASRFLDDASTATDEQKEAAAVAAEAAAKALIGDDIKTPADLDAAIAAMDINKDTDAASTEYVNQSYTGVSSMYADWLTDSARKAGDKTVVANTTESADGTTVNGYYVVMFNGCNDNKSNMINVRHILVNFEGGTEENGTTTYSAEEKAAAKAAAEEILAQWKAGEATESSFAALANEKSTDNGSSSNGGLYENVYPGQMVETFNDWCFDSSRKAGDTGIVETNYGYHVMYFVGTANKTCRQHLIENELTTSAMNEWYQNLVDAMPVSEGDTTYVRKNLIINSGN